MKKVYIFLSVLLLGALAGGLWYIISNLGARPINTQIEGEQSTIPQASLLTVINNNVQKKELAEAEFTEVTTQTATIHEGTQVKTSLTGRAIVESSNQTTTVVDKNSTFTVSEMAENKTVITLTLGNLWAKVKKVFGKGEYYQVETPNSVATVRGTSFGVFYSGNLTTIIVTENSVALLSIDPETKNSIGQEVTVNIGQKGTVLTGYPAKVTNISNSDKKIEWYIFNNQENTDSSGTTGTASNSSANFSTGTFSQTPSSNTSSSASGQASGNPVNSSTQNQTLPSPSPSPSPSSPQTQTNQGVSGTSQVLSEDGTLVPSQEPTFNGPQPEIYSVIPALLYPQQRQITFSITGKNFQTATKVFLGDISVPFTLQDPQTIIANIPSNMIPDTYDIYVQLENGYTVLLAQALTVK